MRCRLGLVETRNSFATWTGWQLRVLATNVSNYSNRNGLSCCGDFYLEKFILAARQTLLYGKIRVIVDPFLPETASMDRSSRNPALTRPALAKSIG
jgi:hypothetical protein